jgi:hypothetical protein
VRYARSSGAAIAYHVVGEGEIDLVFVPDFGSNLVYAWESPYWRSGASSCRRRSATSSSGSSEEKPSQQCLTRYAPPCSSRTSSARRSEWPSLATARGGSCSRSITRPCVASWPFRGEEKDTAGDGFFATFDGPARAIRCAQAIVSGVAGLGLELRAGAHTGECELHDGKLAGLAVSVGARVAGHAGAGEVLVTSTVRDLVSGSGIEFEDRGERELKGVPGAWSLFAAR